MGLRSNSRADDCRGHFPPRLSRLAQMILPKSMSEKPPEFIRKAFPGTWYHPKLKLLAWHPHGVLNDAFADQIIEFIEMEERIQDLPFDRTRTCPV